MINITSTFLASLEHWSLERLIPHARNARTHSDAQIAGSIAEFGFVNPELVDDDEVIAGHGRVLAARTLGLSSRRLAKQSHAIYQCT
jgi:ParB-like chromosome segregation protein Spo0J